VLDDKRLKDSSGQIVAISPAQLSLMRDHIDVEGRQIALTPEMSLAAEIKIGRRKSHLLLIKSVEEVIKREC